MTALTCHSSLWLHSYFVTCKHTHTHTHTRSDRVRPKRQKTGRAAMGWEHGDSHWFLQALLLAEKGELWGFVSFYVFDFHVCPRRAFLPSDWWLGGGVLFNGKGKTPLSLWDKCWSALDACHCPALIVLFPGNTLFSDVISHSSRAKLLLKLWCYWGTHHKDCVIRLEALSISWWLLTKQWLILQDLIRDARVHLWSKLTDRRIRLKFELCCNVRSRTIRLLLISSVRSLLLSFY